MELDVDKICNDFPILNVRHLDKPLIYLDSAATSQKPRKVINAVSGFYKKYNANIHRGLYYLSEAATEKYEKSKKKVAGFINANSIEEIIYVRNATEAINTVALSFGKANVNKGDHILITELEHHSNIVPWQMLAERNGAVLDYVKVNMQTSELDMASFEEELAKSPKILALTHVSNVLGTINDVKSIIHKAHSAGAKVLVDAAQAVPHMPVDVRDIKADFLVFSGHKMLAPSGVGVLYGQKEILESMEPIFGGGDMIMTVDRQGFSVNDLPWRFEAGTPNMEGAIGLGAAVDYLKKLGMENIMNHERRLTRYAIDRLSEIKNVEVFGNDNEKLRVGVIPFDVSGVHPHDVATIFDSEGIAIRAGHHCAMPLVVGVMKKASLSRMSFYIYNKESDVDAVVGAIAKVKQKFRIS